MASASRLAKPSRTYSSSRRAPPWRLRLLERLKWCNMVRLSSLSAHRRFVLRKDFLLARYADQETYPISCGLVHIN